MGNPALTNATGGETPCRWCKYFGGLYESQVHGPYVECLYLRMPFWAYKRGCRHWEPEIGSDGELPAVWQSEP